MAEASHLPVARFQKPHGLKGEAVIFPLTDAPEAVFVPGRVLVPVDADGTPQGDEVVIERARPFHRRWLLKFAGVEHRDALAGWTQRLLGAPTDELTPPGDGQMYYHDLPGCAVVVEGRPVGVARDVLRLPAGELLVVDVEGREVLVPFRPPILRGLDPERREIAIDPPAGLLEL